MNTDTWVEPAADMDRQRLRLEAQRLHTVHQPPVTLESWQTYRQALRQRIADLAGTFPTGFAVDLREHGELRQDGYRIVNVTYQTRPGLRATATLYIPDGEGPFPAVVGTHGHWAQGRLAHRVAARGHTLAKDGFVVLIVDAIGSGERSTVHGEYEYHGKQIGASLLPLGETLLGMQVQDNTRAIDVLQSLPYVNPERIGVTGASGGGNQTMWLAAFDERVKAAVPVVSVGTFESYITNRNCICETLPGGLVATEEWAVLALAAPAAVLILNAMRDSSPAFQIAEMIRSFNGAREIYRLMDAGDKIAYKGIDLPHGYWPEMRSHMLGWFRHWLKDEGTGWPCEIPDIPEVPEEDLMCFAKGKRPAEVKSVLAFAAETGAAIKEEARRERAAESAESARTELARLIAYAPLHVCGAPPMVTGVEEGLRYEKFTLSLVDGTAIPCTRLFSGDLEPSRTVLAVHPGGKAALADNPRIREFLEQGATVCLTDLSNCGERQWDNGALAPCHDAARAELWLGRTMVGVWAGELHAVADWLAATGQTVEIAAWNESALAALALGSLAGVAALDLHDLPGTFVLASNMVPSCSMAAFIPNILQWGDVTRMVALSQCPARVNGLVDLAENRLADSAISTWIDEVTAYAEAFDTVSPLVK